ncbi:MAG: hypothetical protein WC231_02155 [Dehalococcoidales bacterium]|jgi:hypothetical protein|nr:hypothetical protein [Dehalococcoidales bacterium]MDD5604902.1 hypothetical protein [Dehalococcoidales bacterium]MDX9986940.1 hypothetical protein [Dehalococcoidales bacterium]NLE90449.1 hypothetical protein [Dehalococcoidales bacterium]
MNTESNEKAKRMPNRATLGIKLSTKSKLDKNRAPGQCYDGFICQMIELWEEVNGSRFNKPGSRSVNGNV